MESDWQIWLNTNKYTHDANSLDGKMIMTGKTCNTIIGKNVFYHGKKNNIYINDYITIIGYGKIYNENELWKLVEKDPLTITKEHNLQIVVDLYLHFQKMDPKRYAFENILELLEGDFSFILLDFNLFGEECWLYIARDPFGLYPLYYYEQSKKVQFDTELKYFLFSSIQNIENKELTPFISGNYQLFSHSYKVSATWKQINEPKSFYKLPFHSHCVEKRIHDDVYYQYAVNKRLNYISNIKKEDNNRIKIGLISETNIKNENELFEFITFSPDDFGFTVSENSFLQIEYIENEYPSIISRLKLLLNSNDPGVIRSYFIPSMIAKYLCEKMPDIKHVFLVEGFTKDWIEKSYLERNKCISQKYLDENIKGWTSVFISYGIELYMPYLDRILLQKILPKRLI